MFKTDDLEKAICKLFVDYDFQFPIHLVMIGINGAFLNVKLNLSKTGAFSHIILTGRARDLRFPINSMFVDAKGDAAHILFKGSGEPDEITRLKVDQQNFS